MTRPQFVSDDYDPRVRWPLATSFGVEAVLTELSETAAVRDQTIASPGDFIARLREAGIPALRLPVEQGGRGVSLTTLLAFVAELADADPSVAHSLRNHYVFVENTLRSASGSALRDHLPLVAGGGLVGGSFSELHASKAGTTEFTTRLYRVDGELRLTGEKFYSTGNLYADLLLVNAVDEHGEQVAVVLPADREGVDIPNDWDGIGQRLTGSGSTHYRNVRVEPHEVLPSAETQQDKHIQTATFAQLYLSTVIAGILRTVVHDAVRLLKHRRRNYYHGAAESPRDEAVLQSVLGQLSANEFAASAIVTRAATLLELGWQTSDEDQTSALLAASLAAAKAKIVVDEIASRSGWIVFEPGGATAIRSGIDLDRHWRNARTLASHNPDSYKLRIIGDHLVNGAELPTGSFF